MTAIAGIVGGRMAMAGWLGTPPIRNRTCSGSSYTHSSNHEEDHIRYVETVNLRFSVRGRRCWVGPLRTGRGAHLPVCRNSDSPARSNSQSSGIHVYSEVERLVTEIVKQSQDAWRGAYNWSEVEALRDSREEMHEAGNDFLCTNQRVVLGAWVLGPRHSSPWSAVHFIGGIFVGAAPQLAYRLFLERLCEKGILVIATPYASGFDHFLIADEVQYKFDRCLRAMQETVSLGFSHVSLRIISHRNSLFLASGIHWDRSSTY
ncbi:hypothetical protein Cgig2_030272 [Carnegiea gigantea]|uniref:Uncharacterized protein n=1 Tax=Carnegiea gigantea TaxID=171969 RepID=A0A9Q1GJE5_9CARY|nr:hypothetical protein Cgig2_011052 [Carnegiea gigantea]KAJ8427110.1 hypothetical protein Cgig2_030272 [Carnegiea gigantea]